MWYNYVKSSYDFSGHQETYFIFGHKTEAIMVDLLLSTTFGNNKNVNHQISFKIEPEAYLMQIKLFVESIPWLYFWHCMHCELQIHKNVVLFLKDGWIAVGRCSLLYMKTLEKKMV